VKNSIFQIAAKALQTDGYNSLTTTQIKSLCLKVIEQRNKLNKRDTDRSKSRLKALNVSRRNERIARKLERKVYALQNPKRPHIVTKADAWAARDQIDVELRELKRGTPREK